MTAVPKEPNGGAGWRSETWTILHVFAQRGRAEDSVSRPVATPGDVHSWARFREGGGTKAVLPLKQVIHISRRESTVRKGATWRRPSSQRPRRGGRELRPARGL